MALLRASCQLVPLRPLPVLPTMSGQIRGACLAPPTRTNGPSPAIAPNSASTLTSTATGSASVDGAMRAGLPSLRIVHGKGTGALRKAVSDALKSDPRVKSFRAGTLTEGGTGVTMAELQ